MQKNNNKPLLFVAQSFTQHETEILVVGTDTYADLGVYRKNHVQHVDRRTYKYNNRKDCVLPKHQERTKNISFVFWQNSIFSDTFMVLERPLLSK